MGTSPVPIAAHIVVCDKAFAARSALVRSRNVPIQIEPGGRLMAVRELRVFHKGMLGHWIGRIEKIAIVDLVLAESVKPSPRGDFNR